jgi:hypothetical protein
MLWILGKVINGALSLTNSSCSRDSMLGFIAFQV